MRLDWIGIAEASTTDSRGVLTLVGVNQNVAIAESLPAEVKRTVVIYLVDEDASLQPESQLQIRVSVENPKGEEVASQEGELRIVSKPFPTLPGAIQLAIDLDLQVTEYGTYIIKCFVDGPNGMHLEGSKPLHVVQRMKEDSNLSESRAASSN